MTIEELEDDLNDGVVDIGEDGACAVKAATKEEAVLAIRAYVCMNADHDESEKVTDKTVDAAWATIATEEEKKERSEYEEASWYLTFEERAGASVPVWHYDPNEPRC